MNKETADRLRYMDYGSARWNIVYKLINKDRNRELLEEVPHIPFMDLAIIFQYIACHEEDKVELLPVYNEHIKLWDVTVEDLYRDADKNTHLLIPYMARDIREHVYVVLEETGMKKSPPEEFWETDTDTEQAYTLTTENRINGAACMLYPDLIRRFSDCLGENLFILPLSINELIILPYENSDEGEARSLIQEVNDTENTPDEILSYSLYYYDREEYRLLIY